MSLGVWLVVAKLAAAADASRTRRRPRRRVLPPAGDARKIQATLFYVADDGAELVPVSREVPYGATPVEQARRIVEAQVAAPRRRRAVGDSGGHDRPRRVSHAARRGVRRSQRRRSSRGHTGGSLDEALAVFAIVNALTVNLPDITAVQILIDGKEVDTLAGHIDLRHPLGKALDWVRRETGDHTCHH